MSHLKKLDRIIEYRTDPDYLDEKIKKHYRYNLLDEKIKRYFRYTLARFLNMGVIVFFRDIFRFIKNIWTFKRELYMFRTWDYSFTLEMFRRCLIEKEKDMHTWNEDKESLNKKIEKVQRVIQLLDRQLGHHPEYLDWELESREWNELWDIIKGQYGTSQGIKEYDGSGLNGWWD